MSDNLETKIYKAKEEEKSVSFIWLLPILIACVLAWLSYESYMKKGTNISVTFKNAEGLKEGVTTLEYKGLQLGKVTKIEMYEDFKSVKVNILVRSEAAPYIATDSSRFWIRKPTVSLTKISGLSTLISGYKIELAPKFKSHEEYENAKEQYEFQGLESKPDDELLDSGYHISLLANDDENVEIGTPIFYNKFQVGEVISKELKYEKVFIKAYIYDKFNHLINKSSKFYMNDALRVSYGASGLKLEVGSLYSSLVGGITVTTPNKDEAKILKDEVYILYVSKEDLRKKEFFHLRFANASKIDENTEILYKGIKVGQIKSLQLHEEFVEAKAYVYDKYKYLLSQKSKFFIQSPEISIDGAKNLSNIIKGNSISLVYKKGKRSDLFYIEELNEIVKKSNNIEYTLYTHNLNNISKNSKVYYKNFIVGEVINTSLSSNLNQVKIKISIDKKYKDLINDHTIFYDISSKLLEIKNLDISLNYNGLKPLLNGGISILRLKKNALKKKNTFKLYSSYKEVEKIAKTYNDGFYLDVVFSNHIKINENMPLIFENQEIGFIKNIKFSKDESVVKFFIKNKYKQYINKNTRFYKNKFVETKASINGLIFQIDNLSAFLQGSIYLDNSSNKIFNEYRLYSSKDDMLNSSNLISIIFDDVKGVHEEFSSLLYKGVKVGKVKSLELLKDDKVLVKVLVEKNYDEFAKKGSIFYLEKPQISLQKVKNIGSTIMAVNIALVKGTSQEFENTFKGYEKRPSFSFNDIGKVYTVESSHASKVNNDAPIYYKNVEIGRVHKKDISNDGKKVLIECLIFNKYDYLVRKDSKFYDISGFNMKFSIFSGSSVESNTFTSILKGGLMLVTKEVKTPKAKTNDLFILNEELPQNWDKEVKDIK